MWTNGHNRRGAVVIAAALALGATAAPASAQGASLDFGNLSSHANFPLPQVPPIDVPRGLVDGAKKVGITLPERITFGWDVSDNPPSLVSEEYLVAESDKQLTKEGHRKDPEAQAIAEAWAQQAVRGEATFTGDVGRGTTGTEKGKGQIYKLDPQQAAERVTFLQRDEVIEAVETTPTKDPKRYGVAATRDGETIYLVEYFLN
ncbi:hypothetical protein M5J20_05695 [Corynebacterium sp. TA-R-1]|uniref:CAP domain-containing protein n=1 Tax=Corynebacterium stercoris TaxID=2943490 RepID=A0ABT1G0Z6_9CORY|nr:hypothetical protein [Corynebacterium stercoris]MCP1387681.1 hypothetical protein [Corynebacterium stercoris]